MAEKRPPARRPAPVEPSTVPTTYYIVNPSGAIHGVSRAHAQMRLAQGMGWRMASKDEIALYESTPEQRADRPLAIPWEPDVDGGLPDMEPVGEE